MGTDKLKFKRFSSANENSLVDDVLEDINKKGWSVVESFASHTVCDNIRETLKRRKISVNLNSPSPTIFGRTVFNTNVLAVSKDAFDFATHKFIRKIASKYIVDEPQIKCIRSYSISKGHPFFDWHADNIDPVTFETDNSHGINVILYLEDDFERSFWIAENIYNNSGLKDSNRPSLQIIDGWQKDGSIKKIQAKKGDIVIFPEVIYHRHVVSKMSTLDAIWMQIHSSSKGQNEKIIIDPSFLPEDLKVIKFLGCGSKNIGYNNPNSSMYDLRANDLIKIAISCLFYAPISFTLTLARSLNDFLRNNLGFSFSLFKILRRIKKL